MDYKNSNAEVSTVTYDKKEIESKTGNLYEAIVIMSKRATQINSELKTELLEKLEELGVLQNTIVIQPLFLYVLFFLW